MFGNIFRKKSRVSSVGIATSYELNGRGSIPGRGKVFLISIASRPALESTQPPIQWVPESLSSKLKWLGREADHSPPSSSDVRNGGAVTPLPNMSSWHSA
jgi:hypothetical protein